MSIGSNLTGLESCFTFLVPQTIPACGGSYFVCYIIPPASGDRWSRAFVKSSSQQPFNSYCQPGLDGGVYPSSFLLPGLQNPPAALCRSRLYPTFSRSWSLSFFRHFFNTLFYRFRIHFGAQVGTKIVPTSD